MTRHEYEQWLEKDKAGEEIQCFQIRQPSLGWRPFRLSDCRVNVLGEYELVSIQLPRSVVSHFKSIIQFVSLERNHSALRANADILTCNYSDGQCIARQVSVIINGSESVIYSRDPAGNVSTYCGVYSYVGFSEPGGCGSVLFSQDNNKPIIGFHFSGYTEKLNSEGAAVPLWAEALELLCPSEMVSEQEVEVAATEGAQKLSGPHEFVGVVEKKRVPYQNAKSKIKKSSISNRLVQQAVNIETVPCILSPTDPRWKPFLQEGTPMTTGCEKHCKPVLDFPLENLAIVENDMKTKLLYHAKPVLTQVGKTSLNVAVCGVHEIASYPPIKMDTSTGWPWNVDYPKMKREDLLRPQRNEQGEMISCDPHPIFLAKCEEREKNRESGIRPDTVFWDHLKDERKLREKALKPGGTRIFSLSPIDFLVQYRQLNMDVDAAWHEAWLKLNHAVGISPDGPCWSKLARMLLGKGTKLVCLDFSNFGPGLNSQVAAAMERINQAWYAQYQTKSGLEKDQVQREVMIEEVCNANHLMGSYVYRTVCGIPSGHPGTTPLNTKCNQAYIKLA